MSETAQYNPDYLQHHPHAVENPVEAEVVAYAGNQEREQAATYREAARFIMNMSNNNELPQDAIKQVGVPHDPNAPYVEQHAKAGLREARKAIRTERVEAFLGRNGNSVERKPENVAGTILRQLGEKEAASEKQARIKEWSASEKYRHEQYKARKKAEKIAG